MKNDENCEQVEESRSDEEEVQINIYSEWRGYQRVIFWQRSHNWHIQSQLVKKSSQLVKKSPPSGKKKKTPWNDLQKAKEEW